MKKTVIVAALVSTVFSGAAMAWTAGGSGGGDFEMGGDITVTPYSTPWEVEVGAPVIALNSDIIKGTKIVDFNLAKPVPILGIRTVTNSTFSGRAGIAPQIDFKGAVNLDGFVKGVTTLSIPVMDADNPATQIGEMGAKFSSAAVGSWSKGGTATQNGIYADSPGKAFYGGLSKKSAEAIGSGGGAATSFMTAISTEYFAKYNHQNGAHRENNATPFSDSGARYSAYYGSGIQAGNNLKLTLTNPAANDAIKWKASLPVTISYQ